MAKEITYEITERIAILSTAASGWLKELNRVSWNGAAPKYDIREWAPEHTKMGKGITLNDEEAAILVTVLKNRIK